MERIIINKKKIFPITHYIVSIYNSFHSFFVYLLVFLINFKRNRIIWKIEKKVRFFEKTIPKTGKTIMVMDVSSPMKYHLAINVAVELLIGWSLRLKGHNIEYYRCDSSLPQCFIGTKWHQPEKKPPCKTCNLINKSRYLSGKQITCSKWPQEYDSDLITWYEHLMSKNLSELREIEFENLKLGELTWYSLVRSYHMTDLAKDESSLQILRMYLLGGAQLARHFRDTLKNNKPHVVVVFNGVTYPESIVVHIAREFKINVITHETGYNELSVFFSHGPATKYEINIPEDFELTKPENIILDQYLERRMGGNFLMGAAQFWPEMKKIDGELLEKINNYNQVVTIFTNVAFDTSQIYSNSIFSNMFEWLEFTMNIVKNNKCTLFLIRIHPDERECREPVKEFVDHLCNPIYDNLYIIESNNYISSYELVKASNFVIVYNSTIGLEAAILGKPVIAGGLPNYHNSGAVIISDTKESYLNNVELLLEGKNVIDIAEFQTLARRFFYYRNFKASISLALFIENPSDVKIKKFDISSLLPENSNEINSLYNGILYGEPFVV